MHTGLLLVTHDGIAEPLLAQARKILRDPLHGVVAFEVTDGNNGGAAAELERLRNEADLGAGVLVMTDLPGATPANLARALRSADCFVVSGLNLPMLIRAWNYRSRPPDVLAGLAIGGARGSARELL